MLVILGNFENIMLALTVKYKDVAKQDAAQSGKKSNQSYRSCSANCRKALNPPVAEISEMCQWLPL